MVLKSAYVSMQTEQGLPFSFCLFMQREDSDQTAQKYR